MIAVPKAFYRVRSDGTAKPDQCFQVFDAKDIVWKREKLVSDCGKLLGHGQLPCSWEGTAFLQVPVQSMLKILRFGG